jgi:hypothetical protein
MNFRSRSRLQITTFPEFLDSLQMIQYYGIFKITSISKNHRQDKVRNNIKI